MGFLYFLEILDGFCILMQLLLSFFVMVCLDPEKTWENDRTWESCNGLRLIWLLYLFRFFHLTTTHCVLLLRRRFMVFFVWFMTSCLVLGRVRENWRESASRCFIKEATIKQ